MKASNLSFLSFSLIYFIITIRLYYSILSSIITGACNRVSTLHHITFRIQPIRKKESIILSKKKKESIDLVILLEWFFDKVQEGKKNCDSFIYTPKFQHNQSGRVQN